MSRVEVISGRERRRHWSNEQKRSIVAEAFAPGASLSAVARRADIGAGQIYRWRQQLCSDVAGFAQVVVSPPTCETLDVHAVAAVEVALGADIRVRIPVTAPADLACAVIKAVVKR